MGDRNEAIVRRFAISEENYVEVDNTFEISQWGSTKEQDYEFQIAFDLVAEGEKKINIRQVDDLFLAIGYTMQDSELESIFDKCLPEPDGKFTCDVLLEAFDAWKKDQMDEKYIGAVYSMLAEKGKVLPRFPVEYVRKGLPAETLKVDKVALKSVLGQVVYQDPNSTAVTGEDVLGLVDEITCSPKGTENPKEPYISWLDFANLFKK